MTKQFTITDSNIGVFLLTAEINWLNLSEEIHDYITYNFDFDIANLNYKYFIANNNSVIYTQQGIVEYYNDLGEYSINLELEKNGVVIFFPNSTHS